MNKSCLNCDYYFHPIPEGFCDADLNDISTHKCNCWKKWKKDLKSLLEFYFGLPNKEMSFLGRYRNQCSIEKAAKEIRNLSNPTRRHDERRNP